MKKLLLFLLIFQGLLLQAHGVIAPNLISCSDSNVYSENFTLNSNINIALIPLDDAQPGFEASYQIVIENLGRTSLDGDIELAFDITKLQYEASTPFVESFTGNKLRWSYYELEPGEQKFILVDFKIFQPPIVENGDVLNFYATATPLIGDEDPTDNVFQLSQTVVNSFDPNDKRILEGEEITIDKAGDFLHFIVRFQNLGTAPATNVRIQDDLEEKLDWSTFVKISTSHEGEVFINENSIEFIFNGINLPTEEDDREGSKGFVVFKVKPIIGSISVGDVIRNRASIYFDFNSPIITNTAEITYVKNLSISNNEALQIQYYPNPAQNHLFIESIDVITSIEIYDELGRKHQFLQPQSNSYILDISYLKAGQYFINVFSNKNVKVLKVIKL